MVKQFTIPCQFGQETSPVTLYIGHPEGGHHPVHFQSEWLSAKGGKIPQDLMDTLQKLLDLAKENGADFEELCYYALISATQHSVDGTSIDDINKYANEFVKDNAYYENNEEEKNNTNSSSNNEFNENFSNVNQSVNVNNDNNKESNNKNNDDDLLLDDDYLETNNNIQNVVTVESEDAKNINKTKQSAETISDDNVPDIINDMQNDEIINTYTDEDEDLLLSDDLREI